MQKKDRRGDKLKCHPELVSGSYQFGVIGSIYSINIDRFRVGARNDKYIQSLLPATENETYHSVIPIFKHVKKCKNNT